MLSFILEWVFKQTPQPFNCHRFNCVGADGIVPTVDILIVGVPSQSSIHQYELDLTSHLTLNAYIQQTWIQDI